MSPRRRLPLPVGRQPLDAAERRSKVVQLRVTEDERQQLQAAAVHSERDLSDWLRRVVLKEAAKVNARAGRHSREK